MSEKTEATRQAIRKILLETPQDELLKHGIAAHLPAEHRLTPYRVGTYLKIIRKEDQLQSEKEEQPDGR